MALAVVALVVIAETVVTVVAMAPRVVVRATPAAPDKVRLPAPSVTLPQHFLLAEEVAVYTALQESLVLAALVAAVMAVKVVFELLQPQQTLAAAVVVVLVATAPVWSPVVLAAPVSSSSASRKMRKEVQI